MYQKGRHQIRRSYSSQRAQLEEQQRHVDRLQAHLGRKQEQDLIPCKKWSTATVGKKSTDFKELDSFNIEHDKFTKGIT